MTEWVITGPMQFVLATLVVCGIKPHLQVQEPLAHTQRVPGTRVMVGDKQVYHGAARKELQPVGASKR